jgi:hypothetical protein
VAAPPIISLRGCFEVLTAVEIDGQPSFHAEEIEEIGTDGVLATELESLETPAAKAAPHESFCIGGLSSQGTAALDGECTHRRGFGSIDRAVACAAESAAESAPGYRVRRKWAMAAAAAEETVRGRS